VIHVTSGLFVVVRAVADVNEGCTAGAGGADGALTSRAAPGASVPGLPSAREADLFVVRSAQPEDTDALDAVIRARALWMRGRGLEDWDA
jgi:hypothetical protein